ncbi:MAG TPA: hypothetical protein VK900_15400, partial [Anaerolineales bacterium]|nr:hypothetical protein [Anaerolineales bacterium]
MHAVQVGISTTVTETLRLLTPALAAGAGENALSGGHELDSEKAMSQWQAVLVNIGKACYNPPSRYEI